MISMILKISYNNQNHSSLQFLKNVISSSGPRKKNVFSSKFFEKNQLYFYIADFQDFA